jgi:hypothetical protein
MLRTKEGGPPISEGIVDELEHRLGIRLPGEYKKFLLTWNGGRPERDLINVPGCSASPLARVHFFFGIGDPIESCNIEWNLEWFGDRLGTGLLPIATTEGVDKICISLASEEIIFWDGYHGARYLIARDFGEFIDKLFRGEGSPRFDPPS